MYHNLHSFWKRHKHNVWFSITYTILCWMHSWKGPAVFRLSSDPVTNVPNIGQDIIPASHINTSTTLKNDALLNATCLLELCAERHGAVLP